MPGMRQQPWTLGDNTSWAGALDLSCVLALPHRATHQGPCTPGPCPAEPEAAEPPRCSLPGSDGAGRQTDRLLGAWAVAACPSQSPHALWEEQEVSVTEVVSCDLHVVPAQHPCLSAWLQLITVQGVNIPVWHSRSHPVPSPHSLAPTQQLSAHASPKSP